MSRCPHCRHATITGTRSDGTPVVLDLVPNTYLYVDDPWRPVDGGRIVQSVALVAHEAVCPVLVRQREHQRPPATAQRQGVA